MNLGFNFRGGLDRLPGVLDQLVARINTIWGKEHNPATGGHTAITADSIVIDGTPLDIDHVAYTNVQNVFTEPQQIAGDVDTATALEFNESNQPVDLRLFRITGAGQLLYLQSLNDAKTISHGYVTISRLGALAAIGAITERSRTTPMGEWIAEPFNAAHFQGIGSMTWVVAPGGVTVNKYTLVGKTMLWNFVITGAVGGIVTTPLIMTVPGGHTLVAGDYAPITGYAASGGTLITNGACISRTTYIELYVSFVGAVWTAGTNFVVGHVSFEIQ